VGLKEKLKLLVERDAISTGRLTGGSTSLVHVIGVKGIVFNVLLIVFQRLGGVAGGTKRKSEYIEIYSASVGKL